MSLADHMDYINGYIMGKEAAMKESMSSRPPLRGKRATYFVMDEFGKYVPNPIDNLYRKHKEQAVSQKLDEMIAVMQAAKDGKKIQIRRRVPPISSWISLGAATKCLWNFNEYEHRVAPEPSYRPYNNHEMLKLVGSLLKSKESDLVAVVIDSAIEGNARTIQVGTGMDSWFHAERLLKYCTHFDGTPCGVLVTPD